MKILSSIANPAVPAPREAAREFIRVADLSEAAVDLVSRRIALAPLWGSRLHGVNHWLAVLRNGLEIIRHSIDGPLAEEEHRKSARKVVTLFALYHDCCRTTEGHDIEHGMQGAMELRGTNAHALYALGFPPNVVGLAAHACVLHTIVDHPRTSPLLQSDSRCPNDPMDPMGSAAAAMIGACLDADRLDLPRVGVATHPAFLHSEAAIRYVRSMSNVDQYV